MVFQKFLRYFSQIFDLFSAEFPRTFSPQFHLRRLMKNFIICSAACVLFSSASLVISCSSTGDPHPPLIQDTVADAEDCDACDKINTFDAAFA